MPPSDFYPQFLSHAQKSARSWLFDSALPLWWARGADHEGGGFYEKLQQGGSPEGKPMRVRVQARQTYVYAHAGVLGWQGPWRAAMEHGLSFMLTRYRRSDGSFRSTPDEADTAVDLYDQAFVLFALAHAYAARSASPKFAPATLLDIATGLMTRIDADLRLEGGGYRAGLPTQPVLRSNPLMHLLEAMLAWVDAGVSGRFREVAIELCELATDHLIDHDRGAVGECFTDGWAPYGSAAAQSYEPGHQFEWAYLLMKAQSLLGIDTRRTCAALQAFAERHGIDAARGVAFFSVDRDGRPTESRARLWAQTERLRTSLVFAGKGWGDAAVSRRAAMESFTALQRFIDVPLPGLWHEWMDAEGRFDIAPSPASSLYHLMTGMDELVLTGTAAAALPFPEKILT